MHCEKLCTSKPYYLTTKALKQLICNYTTTILLKYKELKHKMSSPKFVKFYCTCILTPRCTPIQMNACIIYMVLVNHVWLCEQLHESDIWQV
jgi:ABC-type antimicrobial peptide transport system ATPase subunit